MCAGGKPVWDHVTSTSNSYWLVRATTQRWVRSGGIFCSPGVETAVTRTAGGSCSVFQERRVCLIDSINASDSLPVKRCLLLCQPLDIMSYLALECFLGKVNLSTLLSGIDVNSIDTTN